MASRSPWHPRRDALAVLALGAAFVGTTAAAASAQKLDVVTDGLANPRGLTFGPGGRLYVAEAGRGGSGPCIPSPEGGDPSCLGATGAVTRVNVRSGGKRRIIERLPSLAPKAGQNAGSDATGPQDISFDGRVGYFTVGLAANPKVRAQLGAAGRRLGGLYRIGRDGRVGRVADLAAYEAAKDPDAGQPSAEVDSNPYSVDATVGDRILVTDAGGNDLLRVSSTGRVSTLAVFRPFGQTLAPPPLGLPAGTKIPYQPVPTGIVRAPGGGAFVGQLTGFPFPVGAANVYRVRGAGAPTVKAGGFTTIVDVAVAGNGSLYVLQISTQGIAGPPSPGKLVEIAADGTRRELAAGQLQEPTGLALSRDGKDVYVANQGGSGTDGQIVRIPVGG